VILTTADGRLDGRRETFEFDRVPIGHDLGWRCWNAAKDNADDGTFGEGLTKDEALADYARNYGSNRS
jgi:hypothetical protein